MIIGTVPEAAAILAPLFAEARGERVAVLHLDPARRLLGVTLEETGGEDQVELPVGRILVNALRLGAHGIVVAHNHPSGDPTPSPADEAATRALSEAAGAVDVRVLDHIIFAGTRSSSFLALGLI
jgi:DNA repair protein RadC